MATDKKDLFERKPVLEAVLELAMPSIIGQIVLVIYNMADTLFVGMTRSDAMITSVTVCLPAFMILSAISNLFGIGGSSVIAGALGRGEKEKAGRVCAFSVWGCFSVTFIYCLCVFMFSDSFIDLLGGKDPMVHCSAYSYMIAAVVIGGIPTALNTLFAHLIRGSGYSRQASFGITLGGLLNVGLDPLFMFVILPDGSEALGAAVATALSNFAALIYYIFIIARHKESFSFSLKLSKETFEDSIPKDVISVGIPACLMTLCENLSYGVLDNLMHAAGTAAQAGIGVAKKINMLAHCFVRGMSQGVLPLIAYNYSSGNHKRMKSVIFVTSTISVFIALLCTGCCLVFAKPLVSLFIHSESQSLLFGRDFLRILFIGAPFSAFAYTVISFFQATGHGTRSLVLALLRKGLIDIPLMFLLRELLPVYGIVWATPLADMLCCIAAAIFFSIFMRRQNLICRKK